MTRAIAVRFSVFLFILALLAVCSGCASPSPTSPLAKQIATATAAAAVDMAGKVPAATNANRAADVNSAADVNAAAITPAATTITEIPLPNVASATTSRVSVASDGTQGNGESLWTSISADGGYVAFTSDADNLVPGDTNGTRDVFVHDRQTGRTSRVSVASDGTQGNGESVWASISADGRYVVFLSEADNLIPDDTNETWDVFVHDRQTGQTSRVSVASNGVQGNDESVLISITADGRYIVFLSVADNLVPYDTNDEPDTFIHDQQTRQTSRVSRPTDGVERDGGSRWPSISADGRYVAFFSGADDLYSGDTYEQMDIFVHDRQTGQTSRVLSGMMRDDADFAALSISAGGRFISFVSGADDLVPGDTNGARDVFVYDRER